MVQTDADFDPFSRDFKLSNQNAIRFFQEMDRMRKVWSNFTPGGPMNKSGLGLLGLLIQLERHGQSRFTVSEIAHYARHSLPATSQKLTVLVDKGYLERVGDPHDRRVCYVQLTAQGREVIEADFHKFLSRIDSALTELGNERAETLIDLMHSLTDIIKRQIQPEQSDKTEETNP